MAKRIQNIKPEKTISAVPEAVPENLAATASNFIETHCTEIMSTRTTNTFA